MRKLGIVPCVVFLFISGLSICIALLEVAPNSTILWWANIEVYSRFRMSFYFLEAVLTPNPLIWAVMFLLLATVSGLVGTSQSTPDFGRVVAFLTNHFAALLLGISLFSARVPKVAINDDSLVASSRAMLSFSVDNSPNLFLLIMTLASCAACHWAFLARQFTARRNVNST